MVLGSIQYFCKQESLRNRVLSYWKVLLTLFSTCSNTYFSDSSVSGCVYLSPNLSYSAESCSLTDDVAYSRSAGVHGSTLLAATQRSSQSIQATLHCPLLAMLRTRSVQSPAKAQNVFCPEQRSKE